MRGSSLVGNTPWEGLAQITPAPVASVDDGHDELDFEAEEPDKIE